MKLRRSKLSGSERQRIDDIYLGRGRYSLKAIARRRARLKGRCE
jgi:hypothetical protein